MTHKLNTTLIFILLLTLQLSAQQATLLFDIKPGTANGIESDAALMVGGNYFFQGKTDAEGQELWVTDGTPAGTRLVKDIDPGSSSGTGGELIAFKDKVWFKADETNAGSELWSSDGTEAGTTVIDVAPGSDDSSPDHLAAGTDYLYFTAWDNSFTRGLYRTDGTAAGTTLITKQLGDAPAEFILEIVTIGNTAYIALDGPTAGQLWKSDGTEAGTVLVKDLNPGQFGKIQNLTPIGNKIYFAGSLTFFGDYQPWVSNGSASGTIRLKDIYPNANADPKWFTLFKGKVYFHASASNAPSTLWVTNGTTVGTQIFQNIYISELNVNGYGLAADADFLYFSGFDFDDGRELWRTNGTVAGTNMVKDINPGFGSSNPRHFSLVNGTLYFSANVDGNGTELCKSDGTGVGTVQLTDFFPASNLNANPHNIQKLGNHLVFMSNHPDYGLELFQINLTSGINFPQQPDLELQIFPNPVSELAILKLPANTSPDAGQLQLYNARGELVWMRTAASSEIEISVESFAPGFYWAIYRNGSSWGRQKLTVVR